MSTAAIHPAVADPVEVFNTQLAHAKLGALKLLQDLMASLTDPEAPIGGTLRELRLVATAILRTKPLDSDTTRPPADGSASSITPPPTPQPSSPTPDASPLDAPSPTNATRHTAIANARSLVCDADPDVVRLLSHPSLPGRGNVLARRGRVERPCLARPSRIFTTAPPHCCTQSSFAGKVFPGCNTEAQLDRTSRKTILRSTGHPHQGAVILAQRSSIFAAGTACDSSRLNRIRMRSLRNGRHNMPTSGRPDDMALIDRLMGLDQRALAMQMRAIQSRAADPRPMVEELDRLCTEYQQLAALGPPSYPFYTVESLHVKAAQCLRDGAGALNLSGDSQGAAARYGAAADAFDAGGKPEDAAKCREKIRDMQVDAGEGIADEVARLQTWVLANLAPSDELAENLVSLAELEVRLGDVHAAREHFEEAVDVVQELKWPDPGQATAEASLMDLIPMVLQDNRDEGNSDTKMKTLGGVLAVVKSRALHRRIYAGMIQVVSDSDPQLADEYDAKIREMGKPMNESSGSMINILAQLGRLAQDPNEGTGPAPRR